MADNEYNDITTQHGNLLYTFDLDTVDELLALLAQNLRRRRLERGLSREALSMMSGVAVPTIAKFEQRHTIALASFVAIAKALGYTNDIKALMTNPIYSTIDELDTINRNKNRQRGRNKFDTKG